MARGRAPSQHLGLYFDLGERPERRQKPSGGYKGRCECKNCLTLDAPVRAPFPYDF
jgi:hypothetical protein